MTVTTVFVFAILVACKHNGRKAAKSLPPVRSPCQRDYLMVVLFVPETSGTFLLLWMSIICGVAGRAVFGSVLLQRVAGWKVSSPLSGLVATFWSMVVHGVVTPA